MGGAWGADGAAVAAGIRAEVHSRGGRARGDAVECVDELHGGAQPGDGGCDSAVECASLERGGGGIPADLAGAGGESVGGGGGVARGLLTDAKILNC